MVKTIKIFEGPIPNFEGVLLLDPDGVDMDEFYRVQDDLSKADFLHTLAYVEGMYSPVLDTTSREGNLSQRLVGADAIRGFLEDKGRV